MSLINWVEGALCFVAVVVGILSSITDLRNGKIYNKIILLSLVVGLPLVIYYYGFLATDLLPSYCCNLGIAIILGFLFYKFKLWAAGDGKLWIVFVFLIPVPIYMTADGNLFPAAYILSFSFSLAFLYLCIDSLVLSFRGNRNKKSPISIPKWNWDSTLIFLNGYLFILLLNLILNRFFGDLMHDNQALYMMLVFLFMLWANKIGMRRKLRIALVILLVVGVSTYLAFNNLSFLALLNWTYLLVMFVLIALKDWAARYNYEDLPVEQIVPGMVLSLPSVLLLRTSRVQGLPQMTDETTRCRLTKEQVDSLNRWKISKQGQLTLTVVRQISFGSFLFLGATVFVLVRWCFIH